MNGIIETEVIYRPPQRVTVRGNDQHGGADMFILSKKCRKCGKVKSVSEFYINRKTRDGYYGECKSCWNSKSKQNYLKSHDSVNERAKQWRLNNLEKARASVRKYLSSIKGKLMRSLNNTEERKEKDRIRALNWAHAHPEKHRERSKQWKKNNIDKVRHIKSVRYAREKGAGGKYTLAQWSKLVEFYCPDRKCLACGKCANLHRDHVIPLVRGGNNHIGNIQPLCLVCNSKKRDKSIDYRPDKGAYARSLQDGS